MQTWMFIEHMKEKFSESLKTDLMTDKERQSLQSYASKKSTLLVVGQTNSGKSSFVNELLAGYSCQLLKHHAHLALSVLNIVRKTISRFVMHLSVWNFLRKRG